MPWEKQYNEAEVLERAMNAFWAHGYEATSMNDLVAATGINRGSIYAGFSDKRTLFIKALRYYDKRYRIDFFDRIDRNCEAKEAILAAFERAAKTATRGKKHGGCLLVNTALELSPHDPEVQALVKASLAEVEEFFFTKIELAKQQGTVRKAVCSRDTAQALLGLFLGLRVLTRSHPDRPILDSIISQARTMLA
jgi:TetR/AcrR family transcriptional repressor of nem operon